MRTETLVRASADIIRITTLNEGDVYKRLADKDYTGNYKALFGIVQSVDFNGVDTLISAIEFDSDFNGIGAPKHKVFGADADLKLFATSLDEVNLHLDDVEKVSAAAVETATKALRAAEATYLTTVNLLEKVRRQGLTAPAVSSELESADVVDAEPADDIGGAF